jgi:hypothetical protein
VFVQRIIWFALIGTLTTGVLGIVMAVSAVLAGNWTGAGILLIASALSFGSVTVAFASSASSSALPTRRATQNGNPPTPPRPPLRIHE